jgi:2,4-dienoyl-CoA reductase (NADPH2)
VRIELGVEADLDSVCGHEPSVVVVATGSRPARPWWAPVEAEWIVDVRDVLEGRVSPRGEVLVVDELGFHQATSVAELLADRECRVEVVTPGMVVGQDLGITLDLENWWIRASARGILQSTVLAVPPEPVDELYFALRAREVPVHRVGDAVAPRRAHAAVIDGERVGAALV